MEGASDSAEGTYNPHIPLDVITNHVLPHLHFKDMADATHALGLTRADISQRSAACVAWLRGPHGVGRPIECHVAWAIRREILARPGFQAVDDEIRTRLRHFSSITSPAIGIAAYDGVLKVAFGEMDEPAVRAIVTWYIEDEWTQACPRDRMHFLSYALNTAVRSPVYCPRSEMVHAILNVVASAGLCPLSTDVLMPVLLESLRAGASDGVIVRDLLAAGRGWGEETSSKDPVLTGVENRCHPDSLRALLKAGFSPDGTDGRCGPLICAFDHWILLGRVLIDAGASLQIFREEGRLFDAIYGVLRQSALIGNVGGPAIPLLTRLLRGTDPEAGREVISSVLEDDIVARVRDPGVVDFLRGFSFDG